MPTTAAEPTKPESNRSRDRRADEPAAGRPLRATLEPIAMGIMALGACLMFQPFARILFSYSFTVILLGVALFIVAGHMAE